MDEKSPRVRKRAVANRTKERNADRIGHSDTPMTNAAVRSEQEEESSSSPSSFPKATTTATMPEPTKGNTGESARYRRLKRIFLFGTVAILPLVYWKVFAGRSPAETNNYIGEAAAKRKEAYFAAQPLDENSQAILENYWTLINIGVARRQLVKGKQRYGKIQATFCEIDWDLQASNPSTVPMFRDLQAQSKHCRGTTTTVADFYQLVQDAKAWDGHHVDHRHIYPKGVVFHETRCGSTLVANLLSGSSPRSRVYSESPPPVAALGACRDNPHHCDPDLHKELIRDVFYMMGRRRPEGNQPQHVFYKIQSIGAMSIDKFTMAFPTIPWLFVYRDTVEILQSHLKGGGRPKVCTRNMKYEESMQPPTTMEAIRDAGRSLDDLNDIEYCAAHLAGLSLAAIHENDRQKQSSSNGGGRFIEYDQLPEVLWETILPDHFGVRPGKQDISRMESISGVYSKGRGKKANAEWNEDSTTKQETASLVVTQAADLFASKVYQRMKTLSSSANN